MVRMGQVAVLLVLGSCSVNVEGDEAFECSDGADNDQNGYFDCQDNGCWFSPDCEGVDTDTNTDTDSDTDTDTDTNPDNVGRDLTSVSIVYDLSFTIDPAWSAVMCSQYGICDCSSTYEGAGTQVEAWGDRVTMQGTYTLKRSDCADAFIEGLWYPEDGQSYHSFRFANGIVLLDDWIAHAGADQWEPWLEAPKSHQQWYITDMATPFDNGAKTARYEQDEEIYLDIVAVMLHHDARFEFNK